MRYNDSFYKKSVFEELAIYALAIWIVLNAAFEQYQGFSFLSTMSMYIFVGIAGVACLFKGTVRIRNNYFLWGLALLGIMIIISGYFLSDALLNVSAMYRRRFYTNIIITLLFSNLMMEKKDVDIVLKAFLWGGVLLSVAFYNEYGFKVFQMSGQMGEAARLGAKFGNQNIVAQRCCFGAVFAVYYFLFAEGKFKKFLYMVATALCFTVVMFTGSKKSLAIVVLEVFYLFSSTSPNKNSVKRLRSVLIAVFMVFFLIVIINTVPAFNVIKVRMQEFMTGLTTGEFSTTDTRRGEMIRVSWQNFLQSPFWGNGMCYSISLFKVYSHNNYIEMLLNFGVFGFSFYYYTYYMNLKNIFKNRSEKNKRITVLFTCIMLAIIIMDIGIVTYYDRYNTILLSLICTYYTYMAKNSNEPELISVSDSEEADVEKDEEDEE